MEDGNLRALPAPVESQRPGPSDWVSKNGSVCDGDYISLRNNAWGGVTLSHSWAVDINQPGGSEVSGVKIKNDGKKGPNAFALSKTRMDNRYTFCVRRVIFDTEKKAWVLPSWTAWKDRKPIGMHDHVILLCPNSPDLVLGTRAPGTYGNNGDYQCELVHMPITTTADLIGHTLTGSVRRLISFGFWRDDKNNVDFLNQSRCIWSFNAIYDKQATVTYGGSPINIRNMWTEIKDREIAIWDAVGGAALSIISGIINSTWNGGRNLTQAGGSDGKVVKLALTNKNRDDKAGWIIDGWHGNRYPVQRALVPTTPPPPPPQGDETLQQQEEEQREIMKTHPDPIIPDLTEMIRNPPPVIPGTSLDIQTGTNIPSRLSDRTQNQNPLSFLDMICHAIFGARWANLNITQQLVIAGALSAGVIIIADEGAKALFNKL